MERERQNGEELGLVNAGRYQRLEETLDKDMFR